MSKRLVALAKLIDPTYRRRRIAPCRSTRRRDDRQPTFRACPSTCATRWRSQASTGSAPPRKEGPAPYALAFSAVDTLRRTTASKVKDLRPLTRSALTGRPLTRRRNRRCPKTAENDRKRSTIRISPSLTSPVPFRDDDAAPAGRLVVRLQDAKNGKYFGEQKVVNTGKTTSTLVNDVLAGTQFHVCAASPSGSPGGPYDADLSY